MRRILPVLLGLVLCVVPASLQAQFGYLTNTGGTTVTITNYTGTNTVVVIPTTNLDGLVVTGIAANAFKKLTNITSITFPDTLTSIGSDAFRENDLTNVLIPAGVTNIGEVPFYQCASLTNIMVDTNNLFYSSLNGVLFDKNLTDIIQYPSGLGGSYALPGTVTNIGSLVFSDNTNLTSVTIPPSVTVIGDEAFLQCYYLTNVCFEGNSSTNFDPGAFEEDDLTNVFYVTGATGWGTTYANVQTNLPGVLPATPCAECAGFAPGPVGSLLVTITPSNAISAGAQWLVDGGLGNGSGATVANLSAGSHIVSYEPVFGWIIPSNQVVTIASNTLTITNGVYSIATSSGALSVVMLPSAISPEAQWQVTGTNDGMVVAVSNLASGATTNLAAGNYEISFTTVSGWITPSNQTVTITTGVTTSASGIYTASNSPSNLVIFLTNGYGTFKPPATLTPGGKYKLTAVPKPKNIFAGWIGGTNQPYSLLSYSTTYTFTNELNLVLEANFETNVFLAAEGAYRGLFGPANESDRQQTNSGSFSMNVTSTGSCSGTLDLGGQNISFSGKLNPDGLAGITTKAIRSVPALDMTLQLDFADQSVSGTISNSDGSLTAVLNGYRAVFGGTEKATAFLGRYTLVVPGVSDSTVIELDQFDKCVEVGILPGRIYQPASHASREPVFTKPALPQRTRRDIGSGRSG